MNKRRGGSWRDDWVNNRSYDNTSMYLINYQDGHILELTKSGVTPVGAGSNFIRWPSLLLLQNPQP